MKCQFTAASQPLGQSLVLTKSGQLNNGFQRCPLPHFQNVGLWHLYWRKDMADVIKALEIGRALVLSGLD